MKTKKIISELESNELESIYGGELVFVIIHGVGQYII